MKKKRRMFRRKEIKNKIEKDWEDDIDLQEKIKKFEMQEKIREREKRNNIKKFDTLLRQ